MQEQPYLSLEKSHQYKQECHSIHTALALIEAHSPYLHRLSHKHPDVIKALSSSKQGELRPMIMSLADEIMHKTELITSDTPLPDEQKLSSHLRICKARIALLLAIAEITNILHVSETARYLSIFAEKVTQQALHYSLRALKTKKLIDFAHVETSGIFILGMGKLGSRDLNYSSDIDVIILYEPSRITYIGNKSLQDAMNMIAHNIVSMLNERTEEGYVFRTDLRLRPDPASTPPSIKVSAATAYYETVGQNWERAAMTKARIIAGDKETGEHFLATIKPFMWRKSLDFSAISDILSIKRQMNQGDSEHITLAGHNVKTGYGGIREIEFLAQLHQLIWGGKQRELQIKNTIQIVKALAQLEHISQEDAEQLTKNYYFLRLVEHRLQMANDQQTHSLPNDDEGLNQLAHFMHYEDAKIFKKTLCSTLKHVHDVYNNAFNDETSLSAGELGNLVFTGVEHDSPTLRTLEGMGFQHPKNISSAIQDWHKGNRRCTRSSRPRTLLTELTPQILSALSDTINPDGAFKRFDVFLSALPSGVQLFSLFISNPELIILISRIMGSAPALGEALSREPHLLESVLTGDFYGDLQTPESLSKQLRVELSYLDSEDRMMEIIHRFKREKEFQVGIQLIDQMVSVETAGTFLTHVADIVLNEVYIIVKSIFEERYGVIENSELAVIALGKMGSHELTFASDIDLIFTYYYDNHTPTYSDGEKSLDAATYYNRLVQRFVGMLTAATRHGILYDIDTRLRPFGKDSALAVTTDALHTYYLETAWVFERLALNRARTVIGSAKISESLNKNIATYIAYPLPREHIAHAIKDMRKRIIASHKDSGNPWNIKHHPGGLMDVDFLIQYHTMCAAEKHPALASTNDAYIRLDLMLESNIINSQEHETLTQSRKLMTSLLFYLRLCGGGTLQEETAPQGLRNILSTAHNMDSFKELKDMLIKCEKKITTLCNNYGF